MLNKLMILFSLISMNAFASGDRVGNGGDVIVCKNKVELLDIYETRINGFKLAQPIGNNYQEMIANLLKNHLKPIQPIRAEKYLKYLDTFTSEAVFLPKIKLNDVDDAGMVAIPIGCNLEQIVIQLSDRERPAGKKRYTISLDLWNKLDEVNKMALVLHEIIYHEAIEYDSSNSMVVRAMVEQLIKEKIDLDIYLSLNADLSKSIEYKKTYFANMNDKAIVSLQTFQSENFIEIMSQSPFIYYYSNSMVMLSLAQIRISDGEIINGQSSQNETVIKLIKANTSTLISLLDEYDHNLKSVWITSTQEMKYIDKIFQGTSPYSIKLDYGSFNLFLENVSKLNFSDSNNFENSINGNFSFNSKNLILKDVKDSTLLFNFQLGITGYLIREGYSKLTNDLGSFACERYSYNDTPPIEYYFAVCSKETVLNFLINKKLIQLTDVFSSDSFTLSASGSLVAGHLEATINTLVNLGKNYKGGLDVFITPGDYTFSYLDSAGMQVINKADQTKYYNIDPSGMVSIFTIP